MVSVIADEKVFKRKFEYFEPELQDAARRLAGMSLENKTKRGKAEIRRKAEKFALWEGRLFCRGSSRLLVLIRQYERTMVLYSMHEKLRHGDSEATKSLLAELF